MAKKNILAKVAKAGRGLVRKAKRAASGSAIAQMNQLDLPAIRAAQMLADPCNAALSPGCYRGDQGFKTRFVANFTVGSGANNTVLTAFIPGTSTLFTLTTATSGVAAAWVNAGTVGATFLAANATAIRSLGACTSVTPVAANLATSGQVYTALVPSSSLNLLGTDIADNVIQLCNKYGKVSIDTPMECKFIPAGADEDYTQPGVISDGSDTNVILMCFLGFPTSTGFIARLTNIVEWKPKPSLGIVTESYLGNPSKNTVEHVKETLRRKDPHWYTNVGKTAYSVLRGYATGGMAGAAGAAMRGVSNFM